jgi:hypothetical protein
VWDFPGFFHYFSEYRYDKIRNLVPYCPADGIQHRSLADCFIADPKRVDRPNDHRREPHPQRLILDNPSKGVIPVLIG